MPAEVVLEFAAPPNGFDVVELGLPNKLEGGAGAVVIVRGVEVPSALGVGFPKPENNEPPPAVPPVVPVPRLPEVCVADAPPNSPPPVPVVDPNIDGFALSPPA